MLIYLMLQGNPMPYITGTSAAIALILLIVGVLLTRHIYKTTLPTRLAETLEKNYKAELARADALEKQNKELLSSKAKLEEEHASIALEYSQLAQLFAKKSIVLEGITGEFTHLADLAEGGKLGEYLRAVRHPVEDIHRTQEPTPGRKRERG